VKNVTCDNKQFYLALYARISEVIEAYRKQSLEDGDCLFLNNTDYTYNATMKGYYKG